MNGGIDELYKYTITQQKKLAKLLEKDLMTILTKVAEDTIHKIQVFINQYWYAKYSPLQYERTYSLIKTLTYKIEGDSVLIYFDLSQAKRKDFEDGMWGSYTDFKGNPSFTDEGFWDSMIDYIDTGSFSTPGSSPNNPRLGMGGSGFIQKTENWLNKYVKNKVYSELSIRVNSYNIF